jgi:hypothetical protein
VVGREVKGFQQFDWLEAKICLLDLHTRTNNQRTKPSKTPTWQHFLQVLAPRVWLVGKSLYNINGNPNSPQDDKLFIPNLCKLHNPHILMDFYLVLFVRVLF